MAGSGSEKRQRQITLKARFTEAEAALVTEQASRAAVSVASLIRYAVLGTPPLRASRQPAIDKEMAARLIGNLGRLACALRECAQDAGKPDPLIEAAHRDIAEMRCVLFQVLGREP